MNTPSISEKQLANLPSFPVMGVRLNPNNSIAMDFSAANPALATLDLKDTVAFDRYVFGQLEKANVQFGFGGYFEKRAIYQRSQVFGIGSKKFRNIHLGIDIWAKAGTPVFAPLDGKVHSFQDNAGFGNYGPTIILEHPVGEATFFTLYGHLALTDLEGLKSGQFIKAGQEFCHLGPFPENGDWPPHLHFQLILDMDGNWGDFPGVCAAEDESKFRRICVDPSIFL
jgi:murein DD-endopeptidase MepM/ murein hydrolase activator NlpD